MSKIPLKYHINVLFYTKYTHPTLICRGADGRTTHGRTDGRTDGRTHGHTENIYSIYRDKLLLLGENVQKWTSTHQSNKVCEATRCWFSLCFPKGTHWRYYWQFGFGSSSQKWTSTHQSNKVCEANRCWFSLCFPKGTHWRYYWRFGFGISSQKWTSTHQSNKVCEATGCWFSLCFPKGTLKILLTVWLWQ
jgi:hypothetical protein